MTYDLVQHRDTFGDVSIVVDGLADFDRAVDAMYRTLVERGEEERLTELCPFFGKLWPAARGLARHLGRLESLAGKSVLEVGCGLAVPGLVAKRRGARVTVSDNHPEVPIFLARNLLLNGLEAVDYVEGDWRDPSIDLGRFDYVVGSDVLYERAHSRLLADMIDRHLAPGGVAIVADPGRAFLQNFEQAMAGRGYESRLTVESVADADTPEVFVVAFNRAPATRPPAH